MLVQAPQEHLVPLCHHGHGVGVVDCVGVLAHRHHEGAVPACGPGLVLQGPAHHQAFALPFDLDVDHGRTVAAGSGHEIRGPGADGEWSAAPIAAFP